MIGIVITRRTVLHVRVAMVDVSSMPLILQVKVMAKEKVLSSVNVIEDGLDDLVRCRLIVDVHQIRCVWVWMLPIDQSVFVR